MYSFNVTLVVFSSIFLLFMAAIWLSPQAAIALAGVLTRRAAYLTDVRNAIQSVKQRHTLELVGHAEAIPEADTATTFDALPASAGLVRYAEDIVG